MAPQDTAECDEAGGITLLSLTIPEGKAPGETFTYTDEDGLELEITVPEEGKAGDTMEILIDDNDDEIEAVSVELGPHIDVTLNMVTFVDDAEDIAEEDGDAAEDGDKAVSVLIAEEEAKIDEDEFDGTNYMVWPAGIELAQFLASPFAKTILDGKRSAVELGSGCGVAGMALAAALARGSDPKDSQVTLTDLPVAMSLLTANFEENKEALVIDSGLQATTAPLTWGDDDCISKLSEKKHDLIIGADLLYNAEEEVLEKLTSTIDRLLDPKTGVVLLSQRWRKFDDERAFFSKMEKLGYEFVQVKSHIAALGGKTTLDDGEEKQDKAYTGLDTMCELSWQAFGNKEDAESQKYFSETSFKAKDGVMKCLSDIDEEDLEVMADGDFDDCELAFIQIFAGRKKE